VPETRLTPADLVRRREPDVSAVALRLIYMLMQSQHADAKLLS
jgi:hypothetical protein